MKNLTSLRKLTGMNLVMILIIAFSSCNCDNKDHNPEMHYTVSLQNPENHTINITLECSGFKADTIYLKMPVWMPGYYQIMDYPQKVTNFSASNLKGDSLSSVVTDNHTWQIIPGKSKRLKINYDVVADRRFVACNFIDTTHAYIIPAATFMYPEGNLNMPVQIDIILPDKWKDIATGLDPVAGIANRFTAPDFDILYDCPVLIGDLVKLTPFTIDGIKHRFIAYNPGEFDGELLMSDLEKIVRTATDMMGEIPYKEYTFIGIGPGFGGIEHLNNATISFTGRGLDQPGAMNRMLGFIAHEYFHNYNVKRIRPYELGPFNYEKENKTNLIWFSEGATVYYEYLLVRRAGLMSDEELTENIAININDFENDPGARYQSLSQSSYNTWNDGPFGRPANGPDRAISYYDKGPVVVMIIDLAIRNATNNTRSFDDVMRYLYNEYYRRLGRGFTDAEFQDACEMVAGTSLSSEFEYVYTTKEIDYAKYLSIAGLKISKETDRNGYKRYHISKIENPEPAQSMIFKSLTGN